MIDLTPLEVRKKKGDFRRALRGYEPALVDDFLDLAADRIEQLVRDNSAMSERLTDLERRVGEYRDREKALTDALVTAQEMREEIRAQTAREADLTRRSATQDAESRLRDAGQRAETQLRDAEQRSQTLLREAEQRAQTLVRESEQHAANTMRAAEQGADDTLRDAQQEAETLRREAQQEAATLQAELVQVREREEETLRRLRLHQQQQLSIYRNFLERELSELEIIVRSLSEESGESAPPPAGRREPEPAELASEAAAAPAASAGTRSVPPRDSRAAAAAAVLAQSFLAEEPERHLGDELRAESEELAEAAFDAEPFEPEPVYEEDLEPRGTGRESGAPPADAATGAEAPEADADTDTELLLENAALAGYHLDLVDELEGEPELLLEEPASEDRNDDDDWLSSMIDERK